MNERRQVISGQEFEEDKSFTVSLRPQGFADFIGQNDLVHNLNIAMTAAKQRNEPLEHVLFSGPPGLGKTTLANIVANEMNAKLHLTSGPAIDRAGDLIGILTNLEAGDFLFIDEIHRLSKVVEEFLYPAMENYKIDFVVDKGPYAKTVQFNLKPFTLVGATTRSGLLASPLRDRFGIFFHLDFYQAKDLKVIIQRSANKLSVALDESAALAIAERSRGTPRIANRLLRRVRDFAQVQLEAPFVVDIDVVNQAMTALRIDTYGLDDTDRRLIQIMNSHYQGGPVGIDALAATLNEEVDTLVDVIEPYLLKQGFIRRTSRGRQLTDTAYRDVLEANIFG